MSEDRTTQVETGNTPSELRNLIADTLREAQTAPAEPAASGAAVETAREGDQPPSRPGIPATGGPGPLEPPKPPAGEPKPPAGEPPREGEPPPAPGEQPAEEPPRPAAIGTEAPQHWAAPDKATFNSLPDAAKAPFLALYKRMETGFQPRLERAATYDRDYAEIDQLFGPHREKLRAQGRGPKEILQIWYNTEAGLVNPEIRDQIIANIIVGYNANVTKIAEHLNAHRGFAQPQPGAGDGRPPAVRGGQTAVEPDLATRLAALENAERQRLEAQVRDHATQAKTLYEKFADARDQAGNLLHPDLELLDPQMAILAEADRKAGKQVDMQDLYDRAAWANPSTRERLLAQRQQDEQKRAADERKAKADAARRASSSVTGAPGPGAAPHDLASPDRSIRDEIRANMTAGIRPNGRI